MKIPLADIEFCVCCGYIKSQCECEKPQTNADRIRAMSDEELAEFLERVEAEGYRDSSITPKMENGYHMGMLQWLKSEVKG